ncbi:MAG: CPBP family intramembrane metalloprotease [Gemmatimonadetes bacterium]|nr:CPBP family intramembrane metalloprotease [Gemmatimonadota bacterium]
MHCTGPETRAQRMPKEGHESHPGGRAPAMAPLTRTSALVSPRDGRVAVAYFALYLASLFVTLESELLHWVTLVVLPLALAWASLSPGRRGWRDALASVGLQRDGLWAGVGWALAGGVAVTVFQTLGSGSGAAVRALFRDGSALYLLPLSFALMLLLAGFTEEFFFRGFLQTRLEALMGRPWPALLLASVLFAVYHVPYALLNPRWPSYGDPGAAWAAAFANGLPGGLILGALYIRTGGRIPACVLLHAAINAAPAMTQIHFGAR